jgi:hypothetical protein
LDLRGREYRQRELYVWNFYQTHESDLLGDLGYERTTTINLEKKKKKGENLLTRLTTIIFLMILLHGVRYKLVISKYILNVALKPLYCHGRLLSCQ